MPLTETTMITLHRRGMTVFLAVSRERSTMDGMTYGSQMETVLSTTVAELYSFMKCFGSSQFLRALWTGTPVKM